MAEPKYKLIYYNSRGLVEPARLIFAYAGVEYDDERFPIDKVHYPKLPEEVKKGLPFGTVPVLEFDGKSISNSIAICRYLAKQFSLSGKDDFEAAKCDEIVGAMQDFTKAAQAMNKESNPEKKALLQKEMMEKTYPMYMSRFEKIVTSNGGKYYVGKDLTWIDLYMAHFMELAKEKFPEPLKNFPGVISAADGVFALPKIKKWIEKRPKDDPVPEN